MAGLGKRSAGRRTAPSGSTLVAVLASMVVATSFGSPPAFAQMPDFGDDTSMFAGDGQCDDPRFEGSGMPRTTFGVDRMRDASDCRALYERGEITLRGAAATPVPELPRETAVAFGDDSGAYASDGECDDPRFEGDGMSAPTFRTEELRDASACRRLYEEGSIALAAEAVDDGSAEPVGAIDFGDDTGAFPSDGECDDPRFTGEGMSAMDFRTEERRDASDCRRLYDAGRIALAGEGGAGAAPAGAIDFGDDSGSYPSDGECDDPRFDGPGMSAPDFRTEERRDATDCRRLFDDGRIALLGGEGGVDGSTADAADIDFGDDSGDYASDGECDDPRFSGPGMSAPDFRTEERRDATDCRRLFEAGRVRLADASPRVSDEELAAVDFGDDSGEFPSDGECDDPRFEGDGMSSPDYRTQERRDATDCRRLFADGYVTLVAPANASPTAPQPGSQPPNTTVEPSAPVSPSNASGAAIDFGDDSSRWAEDGECDDPRFEGDGVAVTADDADIRRDATDCRRLFEEGRISLR